MSPSPLTARRRSALVAAKGLVDRLAKIYGRRYEGLIDADELVALGNLGLVEAAAAFDASRGVPFEGFAWEYVEGRMRRGVRKGVRHKKLGADLRHVACRSLEAELGPYVDPYRQTDSERVPRVDRMVDSAVTAMVVGLTRGPRDAEEALAEERLRRDVRTAIAHLDGREREVMEACFSQGRELGEWADAEGVPYRTAQRVMKSALARLGKRLRAAKKV